MHKPHSPACDENRAPILAVIEPRLRRCRTLLEIGSGTGQHAVYFGAEMPWLTWQTSDVQAYHPGIRAWLDDAGLDNVKPPLALDVLSDSWPEQSFDAVFSANTTHIMSVAAVVAMFEGVGRCLVAGGAFLLYGPFNADGRFTAPSNARFDAHLRAQDPAMGLRDLSWLTELAAHASLTLAENLEMPVNNRTLVWLKG